MMGKEPVNKIHPSQQQIDFIEKCYTEEWMAPREIGKYVGFSEPVIYRALVERGHPIYKRGKKPNVTCPICNNKFKRTPSELKEINCCSKKCRGIYLRRSLSLSCINCKKIYQVKPFQNDRKFCSLDCAYEYSKKGMAVSCQICGKKIWSTPSRPKIFCSKRCFGKANETGHIINCAYCGSPRYIPKCHFRNDQYFCSHKCSIKYRLSNEDYYANILDKSSKAHLKKWSQDIEWAKERRSKLSEEAIKTLKRYNTKPTKIENKIYTLLKDLNIFFVPQKEIISNNYSIKKVYDAYLPKADLFIEIHGSFWHADPRFYPTHEKLKPIQIKNILNDKIKKEIIENELNKKLLIIWEHDILSNEQFVKDLITKCNSN